MKIRRIFIKNIGPFDNLDLRLDGRSIALVGANASGKTFLLSSVVDFIHEHLKLAGFEDVLPATGTSYRYFRITSRRFLKNPRESGFIWIEGKIGDKKIYYLEQYGFEDAKQIARTIEVDAKDIPWPKTGYAKSISSLSEKEMQNAKNVAWNEPIFFLPATRFENESWKTGDFFRDNQKIEKPTVNKMGHSIELYSSIEDNEIWLVNEVMDSKIAPQSLQKRRVLTVEQVLSRLLGSKERLYLHFGFDRDDRLSVRDRNNNTILASLSHLSLGQMSILNLVLNILRLGRQDILPEDIRGLVVIDEIDTHLTGDFKAVIVPNIIKMFPKVQFIITTHDPESVVGLENNCDTKIVELPSGEEIFARDFSELKKLRQHLVIANKDLRRIVGDIRGTDKPILVVEDSYAEIYKIGWLKSRRKAFTKQDLGSVFEIEAPFSIVSAGGHKNLYALLNMPKLPEDINGVKIVGLFDFDEAYNSFKGVSADNSWGNIKGVSEEGLYRVNSDNQRVAMMLPVPQFRSNLACDNFGGNSRLEIELYFKDEILGPKQCGLDPKRPGGITSFLGDKATFWEECIDYPEEAFAEFGKLFDQIELFLGVAKP